MAPLEKTPFPLRTENAVVSYAMYLANLVWPANLSVYYPITRRFPCGWAWWLRQLLVTPCVVVVRESGKRPYLAVGWFWFLGMLVPVIGLVQVGSQSRADRFMYLPMVGLLVMLAWGARELAERWPSAKTIVVGVAVAACAACLTMTLS